MNQLKTWEGEFGDAYTDRNKVDWKVRLPAFETMFSGLDIENVLEVGCNRGHNLKALSTFMEHVAGIEPNWAAIDEARSQNLEVLFGNVFDIPFPDGYFDCVFTAGVLIHVPLEYLTKALDEIYRVSNKYILCIEYYAQDETPLEYRDRKDLLWKRDFKYHYTMQFQDLVEVKSGKWNHEDGFDRVNWWLFRKG